MSTETITVSRAAGCVAAQQEIAAGQEYDGTIPPAPAGTDAAWFAVGYLATWLDAIIARQWA